MNLSRIEITDKEYLIKLNKDDFDLSLISQLLKRIQAESFFAKTQHFQEEEDIKSRKAADELPLYFDHLDDK